MDGVKESITNIGLNLEQARVTVHDRAEWRGLVKRCEMWMSECIGTEVQTQVFGVNHGG